jgi:hypothetical protein
VNEFGCEQRSNTWTVLPGPPINAIPAGCFTRCKPDTLCLPNLPTVVLWQWFMNGTAIPGATSPQFIAQQSGAYWVEMTDYYGCKGTSESLSLNLYDGHGNILGEVWSDVNNNGIIDAADTLVSGIPVLLFQNGTAFDAANSGAAGNFAFPNVLSTNYTVEIDAANLPAIWDVVIGQAPVSLSGCDVVGVAALLIDLNCQVLDTLEIFACAGETIDFQGVPIAAGGNQVFQFTNNQGCDSLLLVQVTTLPVSTGSAVLFACPGSSAGYNGTAIPAGTTQNFTLTNAAGCDSIVTVTVTPLAATTSNVALQACPGSSANYNGTAIPAGATQNFTLINAAGCDSIVTVTVTPLAATTSNVALQACPGSSANYNGTAIPVGTTQNFTLTNAAGCDSIVTVTVAPLAATSGNVALFACIGGSANYNGTAIPVGTTQNFTLTNAAGCDSIVTVNVQAWPNSTGSATLLFACAGGAAEYNGTSIPAGTSQQFTLQNWLGCDSVVTVSVAALPAATGAATLYACPGGAATYNGTSIPVGTSQNFTLQNWLGCDSIVTINVAQWNSTSGAATLYACPGSAATYNGVSVPVGTSQNFTLQNWLGCDSIVTVNVAAWATSNSGFSVGVCPGETYTYQGTSLNAGAVQPFVLQNWLGCDSTVTVTVTPLQPSSLLLPVTVCQGKTFAYNGTTLTAGESRDFSYQNAVGCDSTVTIVVTELPAVTFNITTESACATTQNGSLEAITAPGGTPPFQYALDPANFQNEQFFDNLAAGAYNVYVQDAAGCQYTQPAVIPAIPSLNVTLPNVILPCDSAAVMLSPTVSGGDTATLQFKWWNGSTSPTAMVSDAGPVWLEVSDVCSMERSEAVVTWADLAQDLSIVYVPNIMKPAANNPENARFQPLFAAGIDLIGFKFMVFDRWGNELFETQTLGESWDGVFDGQPMNPGVQVWYLEADVAICGRILHVVKKGDVTVER